MVHKIIRSYYNISFACYLQLVVVSHWMDASFVYGSNQRLADTLREGIGGRLRVEFRDGRPWPPAAANKSAVCDQQTEEEPCYQFGQYF